MKRNKTLTTLLLGSLAAFALMAIPATANHCNADHQKENATQASAKVEGKTIVETAVEAGSFETLVAAVKAAGLVEALSGEGPFTVFAPTDEAFAKLPEGTVEALLKDKDKLAAILTYHVVPGTVMASDVVKVDKAQTLQGQSVMVKVKDETVMIDNAQVVKTDIKCSNGVIHVIDAVIMPDLEKK
jgi:uncharacterized surface protein with fasciclin (FAS1) repeats